MMIPTEVDRKRDGANSVFSAQMSGRTPPRKKPAANLRVTNWA
nr:hypothetical protein [Rhodococcus marinonascens]